MNVKKADFLGEEPAYKKGGIGMFDKMKLKMKKVIKNEKGMTLIELLAVIVIIAIIALIAVPAIGNIINNSKDKAILSDASTIISGAKIAFADGTCTLADKCTGEELQKYVDGQNVDLDATNDYVSKTTTNNKTVYTLKYKGFNKLNPDGKYAKALKDAEGNLTTITSTTLANLMGNK